MKQSLPKSLILSFFLIGIILGLIFLDGYFYRLPSTTEVAPKSQAEAAPSAPAKRPVRDTVAKAMSTVLPPKPPEPSPSVVEPFMCDRQAAQLVRERAREIAEIIDSGGELSVRLGPEWAFYRAGHRSGFVQAFSDADTCLTGRPRHIRFYFEGREVAVADPLTGIMMR